jgi:hypothetical protein
MWKTFVEAVLFPRAVWGLTFLLRGSIVAAIDGLLRRCPRCEKRMASRKVGPWFLRWLPGPGAAHARRGERTYLYCETCGATRREVLFQERALPWVAYGAIAVMILVSFARGGIAR